MMNLLSLTEPNPTDSIVKVKVSQYRDTEKCDKVSHSNILEYLIYASATRASVRLGTACYIISGCTELLTLTAALAESLSADHRRLHACKCLTVGLAMAASADQYSSNPKQAAEI
jgi:hypothetical protein